jgi:hypothetical protein
VRACFMLARGHTIEIGLISMVCTPSSWVREREREICKICPELLFLFLKGMMGALAPLSYLVKK